MSGVKLHGRSLTIMAKGDIYIEREILMGTDELDPLSAEAAMSTDQGMPVHLALVPLRQDDSESTAATSFSAKIVPVS